MAHILAANKAGKRQLVSGGPKAIERSMVRWHDYDEAKLRRKQHAPDMGGVRGNVEGGATTFLMSQGNRRG